MNNSMINFLSAASRLDTYDKEDDFDHTDNTTTSSPFYFQGHDLVNEPDEHLDDLRSELDKKSTKSKSSSLMTIRNNTRSQTSYSVKDFSASQTAFNLAPHLHPSLTRNSSIDALLPRGCFDSDGSASDNPEDDDDHVEKFQKKSTGEKIQSIFDLPDIESLIHEFPCWLMNTVLIQGNLYMTTNFLLYYAHVPPDKNEVIKSGFLSRKTNPAYSSSYWFVLRDHSLSYFEDSTDVYCPYGMIDLKTVLSVQLSTTRPFGFKIFTVNKKYSLQTDSELSLKEWFQALQKAVFRAKHNDHIKIVIPLSSIIDVELVRAFSFAQTLRIKTLEANFALDDHHFVFFERGEEAYQAVHDSFETFKENNPDAKPNTDNFDSSELNESFQSSSSTPEKEPKSNATLGGKVKLSPSAIFRLASRPKSSPPGAHTSSISKEEEPEASVNDGEQILSDLSEKASHGNSDQTHSESKLTSWLKLPNFPSLKSNKTQSEKSLPELPESPAKEDSGSTTSPTFLNFFSLNAPTLETFLPNEKNIHHDFALPDTESILESFGCLFLRVVPRWGKLAITNHFICFQSRIMGMAIKVIVPIGDIKQIERQSGLRLLHHGLSIVTYNSQELFMEFKSSKSRDHALEVIQQQIQIVSQSEPSGSSALDASIYQSDDIKDDADSEAVRQKHRWIQEFDMHNAALPLIPRKENDLSQYPPTGSMHITCLTIGTQGDVQPYIALCKGLMKHGHTCRIATHSEYQEWIESHGIEFRVVAGDPGELMKLCVDNGMFSISFLREGVTKFRTWIDELLVTAWDACQGTDVLIESPSAMAGIHIAERLGIPFFGAFPMPWTRTRAFPHPFAIPDHPMGGSYNYMTYVLIEQVLWKGIGWQVNRWRRKHLNLLNVSLDQLNPHRVPFLYSFSPSIVPPPSDWHDWIHPTGFWFLDNPQVGWTPPEDLEHFLMASPKPFYVGFGSITVPDPVAHINAIIEAAVEAKVRIILSEGWSSRMQGDDKPTINYPKNVFPIKNVPHDWLFPKVAGVVHHGGAGTTAAGLRAGVPTIIKPFFGDQYFWAQQVERMGVGVYLRRLTASKLAAAFTTISDNKMIEKAAAIGHQIRAENGVETAINYIYRDLHYAGSRLTKADVPNINVPDAHQPFSLNSPDQGLTFSRVSSGNQTPVGDNSGPDVGWWMIKHNSGTEDSDKQHQPLSPPSSKSGDKSKEHPPTSPKSA